MKIQKLLMISLSFLLVIGLSACTRKKTEAEDLNQPKILITYYSHSGTTQILASDIQSEVGGTISEIFTIKDYPADYDEAYAVAKQEKEENARPEITDRVYDPQDFDIIYIGYPNWCDTMPMAVYTYLEQYDTTGKTIIPFTTYSEGGFGDSIEQIKKLCPNANVLEGFSVKESEANNAIPNIQTWLKQIGMAKEETK